MRKLIVGVSIIAAMAFLAGCGKQNADVSNTDGESNAKMEESDVKAEESLGYGIGNAKLGDTLGKEWKADQDSGSYSNGCVSASVDSDEELLSYVCILREKICRTAQFAMTEKFILR